MSNKLAHQHAAQLGEALERKRFATLQACAALAGLALTRVDAPGGAYFIAAHWNRRHTLATLDEVETWLTTISGQQS